MLLVRGRIDLWLGHRSCWFKFLALQETSFMALGDSRTATLQNGSSTQTEEIFPREIPSHFSTQMGTQVDRSSRCCKKIFWKCAIKVGAIGFGHFFLLVSFLFSPPHPPFFFFFFSFSCESLALMLVIEHLRIWSLTSLGILTLSHFRAWFPSWKWRSQCFLYLTACQFCLFRHWSIGERDCLL